MKVKFGHYLAPVSICAGLAIVAVASLPAVQNRPPRTDAIDRTASATDTQRHCSSIEATKPVARTELFFGLRKPNGTEVNNAEFQRFLDREVTPRFSDGFTLIAANGQFKNERGTILKERSNLLILLHPVATNDNQKIEQIRKAYITTFQQQSVLRTDQLSCASF
jgi:aromatic ring-cleaving dioxygenase